MTYKKQIVTFNISTGMTVGQVQEKKLQRLCFEVAEVHFQNKIK